MVTCWRTVLLIFSLGLYELFISDIDQAHGNKASSKILVINSLDDLKSRLAKVILMIMIVTLFEEALNMHIAAPIDLVYMGASIALIALALYLTHAADGWPRSGRSGCDRNPRRRKIGSLMRHCLDCWARLFCSAAPQQRWHSPSCSRICKGTSSACRIIAASGCW